MSDVGGSSSGDGGGGSENPKHSRRRVEGGRKWKKVEGGEEFMREINWKGFEYCGLDLFIANDADYRVAIKKGSSQNLGKPLWCFETTFADVIDRSHRYYFERFCIRLRPPPPPPSPPLPSLQLPPSTPANS
ncbi:hypothetical protein M0802_005438 [Mischocyttarus mexicanus]|nr:hypothetical protein M0802_005438 [Mischocyttarus mexicanus]